MLKVVKENGQICCNFNTSIQTTKRKGKYNPKMKILRANYCMKELLLVVKGTPDITLYHMHASHDCTSCLKCITCDDKK